MMPPAPPMPGNSACLALVTVHTISPVASHGPVSCPGVQATGRWLVAGKSVYQARHSSSSQSRTSSLPCEVWMPGTPLVSLQSAGSA